MEGKTRKGKVFRFGGKKEPGRRVPAPLFVLWIQLDPRNDPSPTSPVSPAGHPGEVFFLPRGSGCGPHGEEQGRLWADCPPDSSSVTSVPDASVPGDWGHVASHSLHGTFCQFRKNFGFDPGAGKPSEGGERTGKSKSGSTCFMPHLLSEGLPSASQHRVPALGDTGGHCGRAENGNTQWLPLAPGAV